VTDADQIFQGREARIPAGPWDVIVVGAGIYGLPVAFYLARHGRARVLVVEDRNTPDNDFVQARYHVGPPGATRAIETIDAPVISHWRDIYFRPEGSGLIVGTHHRLLQPDDYEPVGREIAGTRVGLDQVMIDTLLEVMPHFPVLGSSGLNLGRSPRDIAGGAYYMNPEELPFEGLVPGTGGTVFYAGSGCGTGFKLGPGVAWLLFERLAGIPRERRLIASDALSAERAMYFYPPGTSRAELLRQFRGSPRAGAFTRWARPASPAPVPSAAVHDVARIRSRRNEPPGRAGRAG
jgi:glycine/D-amino acid oxidase-like deaminating enzyme